MALAPSIDTPLSLNSGLVLARISGFGTLGRRTAGYPFGEMIEGKFLPSMGSVLAGRYGIGRKPLWIDFSIEPASVPVISYKDVLAGHPATMARLKDKKVLVGGTAVELGDRFSAPNGRVVSGVLVQALAAETILQDRLMRSTSLIARFSGPALVVVMMLLLWRFSASVRVAIVVGSAIAAEFAAMLLQANLAIMADRHCFMWSSLRILQLLPSMKSTFEICSD
jgi:hypothetical protein